MVLRGYTSIISKFATRIPSGSHSHHTEISEQRAEPKPVRAGCPAGSESKNRHEVVFYHLFTALTTPILIGMKHFIYQVPAAGHPSLHDTKKNSKMLCKWVLTYL